MYRDLFSESEIDPMTTEEATKKLLPITLGMLKRDEKLLPGLSKLNEDELACLAEYIAGKILAYNLTGVAWGYDIATIELETLEVSTSERGQ
jgi:hypothetical protein